MDREDSYEMYIESLGTLFYLYKLSPPGTGYNLTHKTKVLAGRDHWLNHNQTIGKIRAMKDIAKVQEKANNIIRKCLTDIINGLPARQLLKRRYTYQYICDGKCVKNADYGIILPCDFSADVRGVFGGGSQMFKTRKAAEEAATKHEQECRFHGKTHIHTVGK